MFFNISASKDDYTVSLKIFNKEIASNFEDTVVRYFNESVARGKAIGRVRALYYDADFSIDEIVKKTGLSAEEIEEMIALDDEE